MLSRHLLFALCLITTPAFADDPPAWQTATMAARAADADAVKTGLMGIKPHVADLEKALADGVASFPPKPGADGKRVVLVDGQAESLLALIAASKAGQSTVTVANPYAEIGLLLALYYNEAHQPDDALRVIDVTFKLKGVQDAYVGLHDAKLLTEQATAYEAQKRWSFALASADAALKAAQNDADKARSHRTRGFNLIELQRLDEAQAAYEESVKLEPNSPIARNEMAYIQRLKLGGPTAPPRQVLTNSGAQPAQPAPATPAPAP